MEIRRAGVEDENHVLNLLSQLLGVQTEGMNWEAAAATFREMVQHPMLGSVFLADEEGEIIGLITLSFLVAIRLGGTYASVEEFIVTEKGRGKGIGGKLLKAALEEGFSRGCYELVVNNPSESGYPVYMKYGLADIGRHLKIKLSPEKG
jgi:GNAT superfamily N-acetyltransferase